MCEQHTMGEIVLKNHKKTWSAMAGVMAGVIMTSVTFPLGTGAGPASGAAKATLAAASAKCGLGTGTPATGSPITLGAIVTQQPGTDFTDLTNRSEERRVGKEGSS